MNVILALYPNARGLSFACIQMPRTLIDCGITNPLPFCINSFLKRIERFLDFYSPKIVVLRGLTPNSYRGKQAEQLITSITKLVFERGLPVHHYTRKQIRDVFDIYDARSKHAIAQKVIERIPELSYLKPKPRKLWMPEDHRMGVIDAVALAITHEHLNE